MLKTQLPRTFFFFFLVGFHEEHFLIIFRLSAVTVYDFDLKRRNQWTFEIKKKKDHCHEYLISERILQYETSISKVFENLNIIFIFCFKN